MEGSIRVEEAPHNHRESWSIQPKGDVMSIKLGFKMFSTERHRDLLKIYEGAFGEGALVAVFHGEEIPEEITVKVLTTKEMKMYPVNLTFFFICRAMRFSSYSKQMNQSLLKDSISTTELNFEGKRNFDSKPAYSGFSMVCS